MENNTNRYIFAPSKSHTVSKAEKTKQFIVEQTAPIFNTKGYAGTSLNDITEATGLTKGSIYGNFANKDEVALAVFDHNLQKINNCINSSMSNCCTVKGQLLVYANRYGDYVKFPEGGCPIMNTAVEADDTHPALRKRASEALTAWKKKLTKLIEQGIANKEFSNVTDPEQVALTLMATIEGALMITKVTGKLSHMKIIMQSVEQMIEDLV